MTQSKLSSFYEVCIGTAIGFAINFAANMWILPWYGFPVSKGQAFSMGLIFTVISVARSYIIRRWFNAKLHAMAQRMAGGSA